jgi:hypothetical protein
MLAKLWFAMIATAIALLVLRGVANQECTPQALVPCFVAPFYLSIKPTVILALQLGLVAGLIATLVWFIRRQLSR